MLSFAELTAMVAVLVQVLKPYLELVLKSDNPLHDNTIRALSLLLGVLAILAEQGLPGTGSAAMKLLYDGGLVGTAAIAGYHATSVVLKNK